MYRKNRALIHELVASAVVGAFIWGIGVLGLELVRLEGKAIAASGVDRLYLLLAAPLFLGVTSYLLVKWSHGYKGPGELITLLKQKSSEFPGWVRATITWVVACVELGTGLSPKGFEGPYIAAAGGLGGWFATKLHLDAVARRRLARCGLGVAFGVLFRTPLGGLLCIFEFGGFEKAGLRKQLAPAIVATSVSVLLAAVTNLPTPFAALPRAAALTAHQVLLLVMLGVCCGAVAVAYVAAIRFARQSFGALGGKLPPVLIPVAGAAVSTALGAMFPIILGSNEVSRVFVQSPVTSLLVVGAVVAKVVATAAADGSKCAGGTVGPAILLGGLVGGLLGGTDPIFLVAGAAALVAPIAGLRLTMLLTAVTWLGFAPHAVVVLLPILVSSMVTKGVELYPYKHLTPAAPNTTQAKAFAN